MVKDAYVTCSYVCFWVFFTSALERLFHFSCHVSLSCH